MIINTLYNTIFTIYINKYNTWYWSIKRDNAVVMFCGSSRTYIAADIYWHSQYKHNPVVVNIMSDQVLH